MLTIRQKLIVALLSLAGLSAGTYLSIVTFSNAPVDIHGLLPEPRSLADVALINAKGEAVGISRFKGHWSFVAIGYTHCPDICPATLMEFRQMRETLRTTALQRDADTRFIFVSVDPGRDSPSVMDQYVGYFDKDFIGLTGNHANLTVFTRSILASYVIPDESKDNYAVAHSIAVHLIDEEGKMRAIFYPPFDTDEMIRNYLDIRVLDERL